MKKILYTLLLATITFPVIGQQYQSQAGFRTGLTNGIFYQFHLARGNAETGMNVMLSFRNQGVQLTALKVFYEMSVSEISDNLFLVWGYGGHAGFYVANRLRYLNEDYYFGNERFIPLVGIDGYGGIEYRFREIPLAISLNLKPYAEITLPAFVNLIPGDLGISFSYCF